MHENGYCHLDIRSANIFVDFSGEFLLGDFDVSSKIGYPIKNLVELYYHSGMSVLNKPAKAEWDYEMLGITLLIEACCKEKYKHKLYNGDSLSWKLIVKTLLENVKHIELREFIVSILSETSEFKTEWKLINTTF